MNHRIEKIEILSEKDFNLLVEMHEFEKFSCSCDKYSDSDNIMRMAIYSNYDMFDELTKQLSKSDVGFRVFGGEKGKRSYIAIEVFFN